MLDMVMWMNKRRVILLLLIAAIVFMVLYAALYPKTVFTLIMDHEDGSRIIYRMNTRGKVTILDYTGPSELDGSVRLPSQAADQAAALAQAALEPGSGPAADGGTVYSLTVGGVTAEGPQLSPAAGELWALLAGYVR